MSSTAATVKIPGLSDEQLKKRNNVLQLIKSLLNSAQGDLNLDQLEKDYRQMVDEAIPYRDLHHATLASLLQSAPEIVQVINRGGTLFVRTSKTAKDHIACLVDGQKKVAKKPTSRSKSPKFHNGAPKKTFAPGSMRRPNKLPLLPNPPVRNGGGGGFGPNGRGGKFFRPTGGRPQQRRPLLGFDSKTLVVNPANVNLNPQRRPTIAQRQPIGPHQDVMWLRNNTAVSTSTTPVVNAPAVSTSNDPGSNTSSSKGVVSNSRPPLIQQKPPPSQQQQQHQQLKARPQPKSPPRQILTNQNNINNNNFNNNLNNKKFYISNNMQIPRAQRSTTHNFPPYCEVPPRFTKNKGAGPKGPKQQLEELAKGMGYKNLIFRSVPFGKNWLATLEMDGKRFTSFPEERSCVEEAEALVADKALKELLAIKKAAESYPVTTDCDTCLSRVGQLVSGEAHGVWFSHLRERYQVSHKENLPFDFCETASEREEKRGDTGIIFTRHENLWILSKKQESKPSDDSSSYPQEQPLSLPVPLHNNFQTFNYNQPQSLPYMEQQQCPPQFPGYPQSLPNTVHQPQSLPYLQMQQSTSPQPQSLPFVSTAQPAAGGASSQARRPTAPLYQAPRPTLVVGMPQTSPPSANLSMSPPVSHCSPVNSFSPPSTPQSPLTRGLEYAAIVLPRQFSSSPSHHQIILPGQLSPPHQPTSPVPLPYFSPADSVKSSPGGCSSLSLDSSATADSSANLMSSLTLTGDRVITQDDEGLAEEEEEEEIVLGDVPQPPILKLPDDDQWDVYVSHITEDNRVCFRLLCDTFNEKYEELMTEMELHYYEKKSCTSPDQIKLGHYYVLHHEETWFRVLISKVTESTVTALFVDHGDTEEVSRENVYELLPKFMELPCQYVLAGLAGLDGLVCDALTTGLQTSVLGQSLVAQVTQRCPALQVILIDTSSDEDVNINEKMLELLPDSYTKPQLPQVGGIAEVFLTYVREDGHLFVTVESETYNMLEHMLSAAKVKAEELTGSGGGGADPTEIEMTKLYLARFPSDSDWHRARPKTPGRLAVTSPLHKALFECIDWGSEETVPLTQVLNLHTLSPALNTLPPQALECVLANVPPQNSSLKWTPRATKRLEELQPQVGPVLLKTVSTSSSGVAEVLLFKRLQPKNELISINETLAMDSDLFAPCSSDNTNASGQLSPRESAAEGSVPPTPIISPPELPSVGAMFDVYVTYAANPDNFAVQSCERYPELEQLRRDMQRHYSSDGSAKQDALQPDDLVEGGFYAALHTDSYWYRVRVSSVMRGADMICGMFVDFGDCFVSSSGSMRRLLPRFSGLPHQSIRAAMAGICPINGDWMPEDTCRFRDLVQDREFVSYVMGVSLDPTLEQPTQKQTGKASVNTRLLLKLVDTSKKEKDLYIDELMVSESRAQHTTTNKSDVVSEKGK